MADICRYCISSSYANICLFICSFWVSPLASACSTLSNVLHWQSFTFHGDQHSIRYRVDPTSLYLAIVAFHHAYRCTYFHNEWNCSGPQFFKSRKLFCRVRVFQPDAYAFRRVLLRVDIADTTGKCSAIHPSFSGDSTMLFVLHLHMCICICLTITDFSMVCAYILTHSLTPPLVFFL